MKRIEFPPKVKEQAYERAQGKCEYCGAALQVGRYQYDHIIPTKLGGPPTLANCRLACSICHDAKTFKEDIPRIVKARHQHRKHIGATRAKVKIPSRPKVSTRKPSRFVKTPLQPKILFRESER